MAILPQHGYNAQTLSSQHQASPISTAAPSVQYPVKFKPTGYAQFADFISSDKELAVYCRFDRTAARILLVLQSRLLFKQQQLDLLDEEDAAARKDDEKFLSSATVCEELRELRSPRDEKRNQLYDELKDALKEYCT